MAEMIRATVKVDLSDLQKFGKAVDEGLANPNSENPVRDALKQWSARYRGFVRQRFDVYSKGGGDWKPLALSTTLRRKDIRKKRARLLKMKKELAKLMDNRTPGKKGWRDKVLKKKFQINELLTKKTKKRTSLARDTRNKNRIVSAGQELAVTVSILRDTGVMFAALDPRAEGKPGALSRMIPFGVEVGFGGPARHEGSKGPTIADIAMFHQVGNERLPRREIIVEPPEKVLQQMAGDMERALKKLGA